jgi:hypothetical protein
MTNGKMQQTIAVTIDGADAGEATVLAAQEWLRRSEIAGLQVRRPSERPADGRMGAVDPAAILAVVLGSQAVIELVKSLHVWITTRKQNVVITIRDGERALTIDAANLRDQQSTVAEALRVFQKV